MKTYNVFNMDNGRTTIMTRSDANATFGKDEFGEMIAGYLPKSDQALPKHFQ